jgi:hypothetical protein
MSERVNCIILTQGLGQTAPKPKADVTNPPLKPHGSWEPITGSVVTFTNPRPSLEWSHKSDGTRTIYAIDTEAGWICVPTSIFPERGSNPIYPNSPQAVTIVCVKVDSK